MKADTLDKIKEIIEKEKGKLSDKYGVSEIGVFGSCASGDFSKKSDIDILVDFEKPIGLLKLIELENYLSSGLGRKVDLVSKSGIKAYIKKNILNSTVYV